MRLPCRFPSRALAAIVLLLALSVAAVLLGQPRPATGVNVAAVLISANPIAAARLPGGTAALPNPTWAAAGAGAIPARLTTCSVLGTAGQSRTFTQSVTVATINGAISGCASGQTVLLRTGTYNLSSGIVLSTSGVTLRGEGPDNTLLVFTNDTSCMGQYAPICFSGNDLGYYVGEGTAPAHTATWTAGYAQGLTSVTISNTTGLAVGQILVLDQLDDTSDTGNVFVCVAQYTGAAGTCTDQGGGGSVLARTNRAQHQMVKVVSCSPACGGSGSTVVNIDRPLAMPNWRSGQSPGAWWGNTGTYETGMGIEDLSIDNLNATSNGHIITMIYVSDSWVKHVRMLYAPSPKTFIVMFGSPRITIRDSYAYGTFDDSGSSTHYGIEEYGSSDCLVENNIWQRRTSPFVRDGTVGSVYAYNFYLDDFYSVSPQWMQAGTYSHAAGNGMVLDEGNSGVGIKNDIVHGTSNLMTYHRNYMIGWESGKTAETSPVNLYAFQRFDNFVGNVLGRTSYHTTYGTGMGSATSIWRFGRDANAVPQDTLAEATMLRWGNWDTVTSTNDTGTNDQTGTRWVAGEVPTGNAFLPNSLPSSQTLPVSLYLSSKPSFMGSADPWPGIGPDVSSGDVSSVGGHVYRPPAQRCFESLSDDTAYGADSSGTRPKRFTCVYPVN